MKTKINSCFVWLSVIHVARFYMRVLFYSSFVCIYARAYVYKSKVHCESAVRFG